MITTEQELLELVERAVKAPAIALDTEFFWERTFYPILGVVQVGFSETDCHLIDAVALPELPHFGRLLAAPDTVKILHDAKQDLSIMSRITGTQPINIFDTKRSAGFAGLESTLSLANLLKTVLNVEIPKTETRSNWLKRPLTPEQVAYAINDVAFLPELMQSLISQATELGNADRLAEEMRSLDLESYTDAAPEEVFRRIKAGRLRGPERKALLELVRWRENEARTRDIPRGHVLKNGDLITIAAKLPRNNADLRNIPKLPRSASQRHSKAILTAVASALNPDHTMPSLPPRERINDDLKQKIDKRLKTMRQRAEKAGIDPALVAPKATVTEIILAENRAPDLFKSEPDNKMPSDWRREFLLP
jgi:ribonuclease D